MLRHNYLISVSLRDWIKQSVARKEWCCMRAVTVAYHLCLEAVILSLIYVPHTASLQTSNEDQIYNFHTWSL